MQIASSFKKAKVFLVLVFFNIHFIYSGPVKPKDPVLRLAVIGLVHDHVNWILNRQKGDVKIVGIVETNKKAIARYQKGIHFQMNYFSITMKVCIKLLNQMQSLLLILQRNI